MSQFAEKGEGAADLDEVVARFSRPLRSFFRKRAYSDQESEDLVQEVFCRLAARDRSAPIEQPEAYIFQMAANLLRDRARRAATRAAMGRELAADGGSFEEISPERVLQGRQQVQALQTALGELPEKTRIVFLLHRFEDYKYAEIAQHLGLSVSSVEKHIMAAMRHLKIRLKGY